MLDENQLPFYVLFNFYQNRKYDLKNIENDVEIQYKSKIFQINEVIKKSDKFIKLK